MKSGPDFAALASLMGDPARANMLAALMAGMALTAGELAREANVTAQTASSHLMQLREAGLIIMEVQGRHRYFRLAGQDVAGALEGLMELAARTGRLRTRPGPRDEAMRYARVCYDHLAGTMGVRLHDACIEQEFVVATSLGLGLSPLGRSRFLAEGIDIHGLESKGPVQCRACMDWSERRHHLAGPLGAALLAHVFGQGWARRDAGGRAVRFSHDGLRAFEQFTALENQKGAKERRTGR